MTIDRATIKKMYNTLSPEAKKRIKKISDMIVTVKQKGGKIVTVIGSGPNLHEGVTTLIAELIHKGVIDGVSTSSAVINHEMSGTLEKVKRFDGVSFGIPKDKLPSSGYMEVSMLPKSQLEQLQYEMPIDMALYRKMRRKKGNTIIKAAGNVAYPTGLWIEKLAREVLAMSKRLGLPFETVAGYGADRLTMIGAGVMKDVPVLVTVPQLVGGGEVGLAIGDSISISERSLRIAKLMDGADVIIESAVALLQEIHDGPFERFIGHGIWADWEGGWSYSLENKRIVRFDLDPNLERAWSQERKSKKVSEAVHKGLPKTKMMSIPFRMEMSGFARIPGSLPIVGDIGVLWPILSTMIADDLGIKLDFMSYNQSLPEGAKMREWIVRNIRYFNRKQMFEKVRQL